MGRPPTGQVVEREGREGRTYALRFSAYGRREYLTLGSTAEGWSRERAERELRHVLADVERGIWRPPDHEPAAPAIEATFHEFASEWFEHRCRELRPSTVEAIRWRLTYVLLPFFAEHRLSEITAREVDRYRQAKVRERDRLRAAVDAGHKVERRPLSNSTINRTIGLLGQILDVAVEYDLISTNPARGRRRQLASDRPRRAYLDSAVQVAVLLDAASELDIEARADRQHVPRPAWPSAASHRSRQSPPTG